MEATFVSEGCLFARRRGRFEVAVSVLPASLAFRVSLKSARIEAVANFPAGMRIKDWFEAEHQIAANRSCPTVTSLR